ncbi:MAG TPA: DUF4190 domain-containing protein [Actinocrinis sp.]|nr:DUF4190 domain-containing protein [Actinocrinis sp.]
MSDPNAQPGNYQSPYPGQPNDSDAPYAAPYGTYPQAPGGYGYPQMQQPARNGMAIAALTLGIIGLVTSFFLIGGALGIVGLILGIISLRTAKRTGAGRGMAIGGIITSAIAMAVSAAVLILGFWVLNKAQNCVQYQNDSTQYSQCLRQQITGNN